MGTQTVEVSGRKFAKDFADVFEKVLNKATFGVSGAIKEKGMGGAAGLLVGSGIGLLIGILLRGIPEIQMILKMITGILRIIAEPLLKIVRIILVPLMEMIRTFMDLAKKMGIFDMIAGLLKLIVGGILSLAGFFGALHGNTDLIEMGDRLSKEGIADIKQGWNKLSRNIELTEGVGNDIIQSGNIIANDISTAGNDMVVAIKNLAIKINNASIPFKSGTSSSGVYYSGTASYAANSPKNPNNIMSLPSSGPITYSSSKSTTTNKNTTSGGGFRE